MLSSAFSRKVLFCQRVFFYISFSFILFLFQCKNESLKTFSLLTRSSEKLWIFAAFQNLGNMPNLWPFCTYILRYPCFKTLHNVKYLPHQTHISNWYFNHKQSFWFIFTITLAKNYPCIYPLESARVLFLVTWISVHISRNLTKCFLLYFSIYTHDYIHKVWNQMENTASGLFCMVFSETLT